MKLKSLKKGRFLGNYVTNRKGSMKTFFKCILRTRKLPKCHKMAWEWLGKLRPWQQSKTDVLSLEELWGIPRQEIFLSSDETEPLLQTKVSGLKNMSVTRRAANPQYQTQMVSSVKRMNSITYSISPSSFRLCAVACSPLRHPVHPSTLVCSKSSVPGNVEVFILRRSCQGSS